jgi:hypothetical protein
MNRGALMRRAGITFMVWLSISGFSGWANSAGEMVLDDYKEGLSEKWDEKIFSGKTRYDLVEENGRLCVRAASRSSASGLFYKIKYDLNDYSVLAWSWKIDHVLPRGDVRTRAGDDCAARVYVVFPHWAFWKTKAIVYIWANGLPRGKAIANPFSANAMMVAVESGSEKAGAWVEEKRNVLEDYQRYFKEDPPKVGAVAIMTDTDNTKDAATAWYGPIRISSGSKQ